MLIGEVVECSHKKLAVYLKQKLRKSCFTKSQNRKKLTSTLNSKKEKKSPKNILCPQQIYRLTDGIIEWMRIFQKNYQNKSLTDLQTV